MKLRFLSLLFLLWFSAGNLAAQVTVSGANPSSNGSYTNLSGAAGAFFGINSYSQTGNTIVITITADVTEPNAGNVALVAGAWTSMLIQPSGGSWTISASVSSGGMIALNGADNVTIDGSISGVTSLTITNTNSSGTAMAIKLYNDATNNTIKYCNLKGRNAAARSATDGGIITIAGTTGSTGNDNNYIQNCDFGPDAATLPYILIKGYGSVNSNDLCQVTNCTLHDWIDLTAANSSCAIYLASTFVSSWTISGNKLYQSATRDITAGGANDFYGIEIEGGGGYTISNNTIGYSSSSGTGYLTYTDNISGAHTSIDLYPIYLNLSTVTSSTISGNIITNIDFTSARSTNSGTTYGFVGIWLKAGKATISGNTIGSSSGTGSVLFKQNIQTGSPTTPFLPVCGILVSGTSNNTISNNIIGGITMSYTGTGLIGTYGGNPFICIYSTSTGTTTISGNTIGNSVSNNITTANTISGANITGIKVVSGGTATISTNTIQNLNCSGANTGTGTNASVIGIQIVTPSATNTDGITSNVINNLTNSAVTASAVEVRGMHITGSTAGPCTIQQNWIYSLSVTSTSSSSVINGITTGGGSGSGFNVYNNMISLGNGISSGISISGIQYSLGTPLTGYYNTIRILGTPTSGTGNSYCFYYSGTALTLTLKDDLFVNERSNSGSTGKHYSIYFTNSITYTGSYNDFFISGTGGVLGHTTAGDQADLSAWKTATSQDGTGTISSNYTYVSTTDLHLVLTACDINNAGTPVTPVIDYDGSSRSGSTPDIGADEVSPTITWTGATGTDWNTSTNWSPQTVPATYNDVVIPVVATVYPIITSTTATCHSLNINASASLTMNSASKLTLDATCSNATFTNAGTFTANSNSEVVFSGSPNTATIVPTAATQFENVTINIGVNMGGSSTTVNGILQLKSGSYVSGGTAPTYSANSTLQYNTNGSYTASAEWYDNTFSGAGWPQNVDITGTSTSLVFNTGYPREMRGNLTIGSTCSLTLSASFSGGDLYIKGNWTRAATGTFNPVGRGVKFNGTTNQTITVTGGGTETFHYVTINKASGDLYLSNTAGSLTSMKITMYNYAGAAYTYLTMSGGNINLNGQTFYWAAPSSMTPGQTAAYWNATSATRYVTGTGTVSVTGTLNATSFEVTSSSMGTLVFDANVTLTDATGEVNFGTGNLTTIKGVFQVDNGGAAVVNSAHYDVGSTLRFTNGNDYQVVLNDITWANGTSGDIGIPYHLEITTAGSSTDLIIQASNTADHMIRGNLIITSSTLQLSTGASGNLYIQGNWTRTNGSFTPNSKTVIFSGTSLQTISLNSSYETYYGLTINNSAGVALSGATSSISISNLLTLTAGLITTNSSEVSITSNSIAAISYPASNSSASSWVNGNLRRKITTGNYAFPVGSSTTMSGNGYELAFLDFATNSNVDNILTKFTSDATTTSNETFSLVVTGTTIVDRLNAGYWNFKPYDAGLSLVGSPNCSYNVQLNERGHTNSAINPYYYAVIKRTDCVDPCATPWNQQCGTHTNATQTEPVIGQTAHAERTGYGCSTFSDYAVGIGEFILPLELTDFTVTPVNYDAFLDWSTAAEYNSDYFAVERSLDAIHFEQIGTVHAANFSSKQLDYQYTDYHIDELLANKIFYRLRMVDLDSSFEYSAVRWIDLNDAALPAGVNIFPNPFNNEFSISINSASDQDIAIQLVDISGRVMRDLSIHMSKGLNFVSLNQLNDIASGMYFVNVYSGRILYTAKVVKD